MQTRRDFLLNGMGLLLAPMVSTASSPLMRTPRQPIGPFYPNKLPLDDDNDLTRVAGTAQRAKGTVVDLQGRLLDRNGKPLHGMRIEIWQCDVNGRYRHPWDRGDLPQDPGFQGHGHTYSDSEGRYRFRTIRPVHYPGRTPHIHAAVFPVDQTSFVTQLYVAGEPDNESDTLYRRIPEAQRHLVTAEFRPASGSPTQLSADWDLILGLNARRRTPT